MARLMGERRDVRQEKCDAVHPITVFFFGVQRRFESTHFLS